MSTNSSNSYSITRNDIIKMALQELNILKDDESLPSSELHLVSDRLNMLLKKWQKYLNYWQDTEYLLFLNPNQNTYLLGSDPNFTVNSLITTVFADAAQGATTISVSSTDGLIADQNINIIDDIGNLEATTIVSVSSNSIVIVDPLVFSASAGNYIYSTQGTASRPLAIRSIRLMIDNTTEQWVSKFDSREDYFRLPNKSVAGSPRQFYYDPTRTTPGYLYLWPTPQDSTQYLKITGSRPLSDVLLGSDEADIPQEVQHALILNLAYVISRPYEKSEQFRQSLLRDAEEAFQEMLMSQNPNGGALEIDLDYGYSE